MASRVVLGTIAAVVLVLCVGGCSSDSGNTEPSTSASPESASQASPERTPSTPSEKEITSSQPDPPHTPSSPSPPSELENEITIDLGDGVTMKMVLIPAGEFKMGSPDSDSSPYIREKPQHRVRITKPFYLGTTEVTQGQYEKVMGSNPSRFKESGPDAPVENVTWIDAHEFCRKLPDLAEEKKAGWRYRLPTEAQWEYACRAGSEAKYCYGDDASRLGDYAWHKDNSAFKTHQVGQKKPNAWGLYDMHGNVWEWCEDWYGEDYYESSPAVDPTGPSTGPDRVYRGGGWFLVTETCRSAFRVSTPPDGRHFGLGFRVVLVPAE